jgi:hypothetical protein
LRFERVPAGPETSYRRARGTPATRARRPPYAGGSPKEKPMPIILWLLGVPLGIVLLLVLFGVI